MRSLEGQAEILEMERDKSAEERQRMEAILESFHEQDTMSSSLELDRARREAQTANSALRERDAKVAYLSERVDRLASVEEEAQKLRLQVVLPLMPWWRAVMLYRPCLP